MNNFKNITRDLNTFSKFIKNLDINMDCSICEDNGLYCCGNCHDNLIQFLKLKPIIKTDNSIDTKDWNKYNDRLNIVLSTLGEPYLDINYLINRLRGWREENLELNENQKLIILDLEKSYHDKLKQIRRLQEVFDIVR